MMKIVILPGDFPVIKVCGKEEKGALFSVLE